MSASWTPAKADLTNLKSAELVFRFTVQGKYVYSPPVPMFNKDTYQVVDQDGINLTTNLTFRFSGGHLENDKAAVNGTVDIVYPWNQTVSRMLLPGQDGARVSLEDGSGGAPRNFTTPS
jgi:hypothetical protein